MTDRANTLGPMPPPPYGNEEAVIEEHHDIVGPSRVSDHNGESNRDEYVQNLEAEVQGMRERIAELESLQSHQLPVSIPPVANVQSIPPTYSIPPVLTRPMGTSISQPQAANPFHSTNPFLNTTPFRTIPQSEPKQ